MKSIIQESENNVKSNSNSNRFERQLDDVRQQLRTCKEKEEEVRLQYEQELFKEKSKTNMENTSKVGFEYKPIYET